MVKGQICLFITSKHVQKLTVKSMIKFNSLRVEKYRKPTWATEGEFVSKFEINAFEINVGKGTRHFNPLKDYRFFHHWFSRVKTP